MFGKLVILIFTLYTAMFLVGLQGQINEKKIEQEELAREISNQKLINAALQEDIISEAQEEHSVRMARMARERLGLVAPGEILIINKTP